VVVHLAKCDTLTQWGITHRVQNTARLSHRDCEAKSDTDTHTEAKSDTDTHTRAHAHAQITTYSPLKEFTKDVS